MSRDFGERASTENVEDARVIAELRAALAATRLDAEKMSNWREQFEKRAIRAEAECERLRERVRELEDAVRQALDCRGAYNGTVSEQGGSPAVCARCVEALESAMGAGQA